MSTLVPFPQPRRVLRAASSAATLNPSRRLHLYDPTREERTHRALDLADQVGIAVSHISAEVQLAATRERLRRLTAG